MGRTEYVNRIIYQLGVLAVRVKANSQNGRTDINVDSEMTVCGLLNQLMGWELKNLNDRKANFPGIDLADWDRRIAVQVTATATGHKVNHTLDEFLKNRFDGSFDRLIVVIITTDKLPAATAREQGNFSFNPDTHIWNISTLMSFVKNITDTEKLEEIANYLEKEIGSPAPTPVSRDEQKRSARKIMWFAGVLALVVAVIAILGGSRAPQIPQSNVEGTENLLMWDVVTETLRKEKLTKTTVPLSDYESGLNVHGNLGSARERSVSYPFTLCCANTATNPIAAFNAVRSEWFVSRDMSAEIFELPLRNDFETQDPYAWQEYLDKIPEAQEEGWEWSETGVEAFLCDVLAVAGKCEDNLDFDDKFLSALHRSEEPVVHFSAADQCYYTYFIYYGDYTSHLICMYFRADKENSTQIMDVEFQMLNMSYYFSGGLGFSGSQAEISNGCKSQVASLIMSIEHLLAGSSGFDSEIYRIDGDSTEMTIPLDYSVGDYQVSIMQNSYVGSAVGTDAVGDSVERCELITYRIHK